MQYMFLDLCMRYNVHHMAYSNCCLGKSFDDTLCNDFHLHHCMLCMISGIFHNRCLNFAKNPSLQSVQVFLSVHFLQLISHCLPNAVRIEEIIIFSLLVITRIDQLFLFTTIWKFPILLFHSYGSYVLFDEIREGTEVFFLLFLMIRNFATFSEERYVKYYIFSSF